MNSKTQQTSTMMRRFPVLALAAALPVLAMGCEGAGTAGEMPMQDAAPTVEFVNARSAAAGEGVLPFSGAVWVDNTFYVSGMLGLEGGQVPETAEQEATNVLDGVKGVLEGEGLTMDDLVVVQVFASDVADYDAFNSVYRTYFTGDFPARAFLGSGPLLFGMRFEMQAIAVR